MGIVGGGVVGALARRKKIQGFREMREVVQREIHGLQGQWICMIMRGIGKGGLVDEL